MNVRAFGAVADGVTDCSAAFQRAHDAVVATGGTIFVPRGTYVLNTPLRFAPGNGGWVRLVGEGVGGTVIRAGGGNGQLTQFGKRADGDTFRNIEIADLTFDCRDQPSGTGHVLVGVRPWGPVEPYTVYQTRLNFDNIALRRVRAINVPSDAARGVAGVCLASVVATAADAEQLWITDVTLDDVRIDGGAHGFGVYGTAQSGSIYDGNVKVFLDRISIVRCHHDTGAVPTAATKTGNFHIGGVGFGGSVRMRDCHGANAGDIGIEVDGMTDAVVEGCTVVDAYRNFFLAANYRRPDNIGAQRYVFKECTARSHKVDASITGSQRHHFGLQADPAKPHYEFGHLALVGCTSRSDTPLASFSVRGMCVYAANARFRGLTIRDLDVGLQQIAARNAVTENPSLIDVVPANDASVRIDGVHFRLAGSRSGAGRMNLRFVRLSGRVRAQVDNVTVQAQVTGMTRSTDFHRIVDVGDIAGSAVRAQLRGVRVVEYASAADVRGIGIASTATLAIPAAARIVASGCDFEAAPAGAGVDYDVHPSQVGRFAVRDSTGRASQAAGVVPAASPWRYVNADHEAQCLALTGGTVTRVEWSADGITFFDTAQKAGVFRLEPGHALRVTYSAAPRVTKVPV